MSASIAATHPLLPDYFALHGKWRKDKPALIAGDERLSWSQFNARLNRVANGFADEGLKKGDVVIVFMSNSGPMAETLFGLMMGGFVSAPLNLSVTDEAIIGMVKDSGAKAIVVTRDQAPRIQALLPRLPEQATEILLCAEGDMAGFISFESWRDGQAADRPATNINPDDYLNIIYSSGTTGRPKGIVHTHQGRRDWAYDLANALRYNSSARFLATIGLYSNITWVGMLCTLLSGGTLFIERRFDSAKLWQRLQDERITHLSMVPVMYERMMAAADHERYDVTHMQGMMSAGSPLRPAIREKLFNRFDCGIIELYGLTEGVITTLDPEDAAGRMDSVGVPILGSDLLILDEADEICPPDQSGEILMATRFVMPGYLNREDATLEARYIDDEGRHWLRTGDIGYLDAEGFLYIVDRKKDMILSGGQNIYPQDIEAVLAEREDILDVAVIGVASTRWGETPLAVIAPRGNSCDKGEIKEWANARLGKQQRLAGVEFVKEIPRNPNGKILKRELRERYKDMQFD